MERKPEFADLPIAELLRRLASDVSDLVRHEIRLAQAELTEKGRSLAASVGSSVAAFAIAAVLGLGVFVALTVAFIAGLSIVLPTWGAALAVAAVYAILAGGAALAGKSALSGIAAPLPDRTIASVKADVATVASSLRRTR